MLRVIGRKPCGVIRSRGMSKASDAPHKAESLIGRLRCGWRAFGNTQAMPRQKAVLEGSRRSTASAGRLSILAIAVASIVHSGAGCPEAVFR